MTTTDKHLAYMAGTYTHTDDEGVHHYTEEQPVHCGDYDQDGKVMCDACLEQARKDYPQGWEHYPGDVCPHGNYTGGCGIDWMCGLCEAGLTERVELPMYGLALTFGDLEPYQTREQAESTRLKWNAEQESIDAAWARVHAESMRIDEIQDNALILKMVRWQAIQIATGYWDMPDEEG